MKSTRSTLAALFLLAMSVLLMEVCLTRVFSVLSWHHFAYLIISLALLGFGAAGSYLTAADRLGKPPPPLSELGRYAWRYAIAVMVAMVLVSKLRFYPEDIQQGDYSNLLSLLLIDVIVAIPFFFAGICIGRLVALAGDAVNSFYFVDLVGAGLGALAALAVLNTLGAVAGVFAAAALGALAACCLGAEGCRARRWVYGLTLLAAIALVPLTANTRVLPLYYPPSKEMFRKEGQVEFTGWNVVGKIDILKPSPVPWSFGGWLSDRFTNASPEVRGIFQDGCAPTGILNVRGRPEDEPILGEYLQAAAYTVKRPDDVLVIGIGGGADGLIAMHHGAGRVVGVDINPVTVRAVSTRFRDWCPGLWAEPGRFRMEVSEGRHYLTRTGDRFDVIQLSGVDTFTALASGAYTLSENFLYTQEAQRDYWRHLKPGGILSFSRWLFSPPRETLRLVNTQLAMLEAEGVARPADHLVVVSGGTYQPDRSPWAETLLKQTPFTAEEVDRVVAWADARGFQMIYDPFHARTNTFNAFIGATPQARVGLVADYPYHVGPTTDDSPFFFNFYRWGSLTHMSRDRGGLTGSSGGYSITRLPLGLLILAASLVQILILSAAFILAPLAIRRGPRTAAPGRFGVFVYFAALGLGFMFVEIALLQKFTVFVGGPVYSMAITLASILVCSGIGAFLARGLAARPGRGLAVVLVAIVAAILLESVFLNRFLPTLLGLSLHTRWLVTGLACLPVGLLLGMPFPTGLRILERLAPEARAWAWGVNAFATVLGSMLAVMLSIECGFTAALYTACAIYLTGGLGLWWAHRRAGRSQVALE